MKVRIFILFIINGFILAGCGNSPQKQQEKTVVQQINPLEKKFKGIIALDSIYHNDEKRITFKQRNDSLRYFIYTDVVKKRILHSTSQKYFDKLSSLITYSISDPVIFFEVKYEDSAYKYLVYNGYMERRAGTPTLELNYKPKDNMFTCSLMENGRVVQSDGEIHYNTEGWSIDTHDVKNEFGEVVETECVAGYTIDGIEYSYSKYKFALVLRWNYLTLWTNEFGSLSDVESIQIKDHDSGKIYNIRYDERHHHQNGGAMNDDIGVFIVKENMGDFIRLVSGLTNFSILIKSNYDDSVLISKPENFNNIADAYQQIIVNTQKLRENENK